MHGGSSLIAAIASPIRHVMLLPSISDGGNTVRIVLVWMSMVLALPEVSVWACTSTLH